jgi:hypothetical protein
MKLSSPLRPIFLKQIWQMLYQCLSTGSELRVWQATTHHRHCWRAYDPLTGDSACFSSEAEMRLWIEQRYYLH